MAPFKEDCPKVGRKKAHRAHSRKRKRLTLGGWVTDTYKCPGVREFGR